MNKFIVSFCILVISYGVFAQRKSPASNPKPNKSFHTVTADRYSDEPLDETAQFLRPQYKGHSFSVIHNALKLLPVKKSEFETTAQHEARLARLFKTEVTGSLTLESDYAFSYVNPGGLSFDSLESTYDADKQVLYVVIKASFALLGSGISGGLDDRALTINLSNVRSLGSYMASNAFGARFRVVKGEFDADQVVFSKCQGEKESDLFSRERYHDKELLTAIRDVKVVEAMALKRDLRVLVIGNLVPPYSARERALFGAPTITQRSEFWKVKRYLFLRIKSVWLYSISTGKIYVKLGNCSGSG